MSQIEIRCDKKNQFELILLFDVECIKRNSVILSFFLSFHFRTYHITCISATQAALYKSVIDTCGDTETFNVTFGKADGVQAATTYECSIKLEADGSKSAKSIPVDVLTPLLLQG